MRLPLYIVSHLVIFEVCKHRRKCLDKTMFLSESSYLYVSCYHPEVV
ncbi:hypothetical protein Taro_032830, partial [Colocasia esculenta]|nr:hypothetical protein [Colocasia esculenta]